MASSGARKNHKRKGELKEKSEHNSDKHERKRSSKHGKDAKEDVLQQLKIKGGPPKGKQKDTPKKLPESDRHHKRSARRSRDRSTDSSSSTSSSSNSSDTSSSTSVDNAKNARSRQVRNDAATTGGSSSRESPRAQPTTSKAASRRSPRSRPSQSRAAQRSRDRSGNSSRSSSSSSSSSSRGSRGSGRRAGGEHTAYRGGLGRNASSNSDKRSLEIATTKRSRPSNHRETRGSNGRSRDSSSSSNSGDGRRHREGRTQSAAKRGFERKESPLIMKSTATASRKCSPSRTKRPPSPSPKRWNPSPSPTAPQTRRSDAMDGRRSRSPTNARKKGRSPDDGRRSQSHPPRHDKPHSRHSPDKNGRGDHRSSRNPDRAVERDTYNSREVNVKGRDGHRASRPQEYGREGEKPKAQRPRSHSRSRTRSREERHHRSDRRERAETNTDEETPKKRGSSADAQDGAGAKGSLVERNGSGNGKAPRKSEDGGNARGGAGGVMPAVTSSKSRSTMTPKSGSKGNVGVKKDKSKVKREGPTGLLSFEDDMGDNPGGSAFQGLAAATEQEFKRLKKTPGIENGTHEAAPEGVETETPVAANLDFLFEKKRNPVLGPAKISAAESRGQRPYQEDRHVVVSCLHSPDDAHSKFDPCPPCFFAVYDGHNGDLATEIAKNKLHTFVAKAAPATGLRGQPPELLEGLLRAAFASTEEEILKQTEEDGGRQDGTTVTACLLVGDLLVVANVGDSRAVLGSVGHTEEKHRCKSISSDHTPATPSERRRIEKAGGEVVFNGCFRVQHEDVNCRLAVSRSLGDRQFKGNGGQPRGSQEKAKGEGQLVSPEPALKSMKLGPQDRVVIVASDGLWDVMSNAEAVEIALAAHARAPSSAGRAPSWARALSNGIEGENAEADPANALVKEAVKRGTADNVTAIAVVLPWD